MRNDNIFDINVYYNKMKIIKVLSLNSVENSDRIYDVFESVINDFKKLLILDMPKDAINVIDDLIHYDDITGWETWYVYNNKNDKSYLHAISRIIKRAQDAMMILSSLIIDKEASYFNINDFRMAIFDIDDLMTISKEMINKRLDKRKCGANLGKISRELKGLLDATVDLLIKMKNTSGNDRIMRRGVIIPLSELVWEYFEKYTSENQLCYGDYEIYVDGDKIYQDSPNSHLSIKKSTFSSYVTKAKKIARAKIFSE